MRISVPEQIKLDAKPFIRSGNALRSFCIKVSQNTAGGEEDSSMASTLTLVKIPNDVATDIEVFYSEAACDGAKGVDSYAANSPKIKFFDNLVAGKRRYFVETSAGDVCRGPRLASTSFATGFGTSFHPYGICTPEQWNSIGGTNFSTNQSKSFDVLSHLNFNFGPIVMIGGDSQSGSSPYAGVFNGNNLKIENGRLKCIAGINNQAGIFRITDQTVIKNITFNQIVNLCDTANHSGGVVGEAHNTEFLNVKFFGAVNGKQYVGGLAGKMFNNNSAYQNAVLKSHVNAKVNSRIISCGSPNYVGGVVGKVESYYTGTEVFKVSESSFKGDVSSSCSSNSDYASHSGGFAGEVFNTGTKGNVIFEKLVIKANKIEGSQYLGGIVGFLNKMTIEDSYSNSHLSSTYSISGAYVGGLVGKATTNLDLLTSFSADSFKKVSIPGDTNIGGLVGWAPGGSCPNSYYFGSNANNFICGTEIVGDANIFNYDQYVSFSLATWEMPTPGHDYPRLKWESTKESEVPYLARECTGSLMFSASPTGAGTILNPYVICSVTQFNNMTAGNFYSLKKDLNFADVVLPSFSQGIYRLNGNNFTLSNFKLDITNNGSSGLFSSLNNFSLIKNLNLLGITVSPLLTQVEDSVFGILAGVNDGTIDNVNISLSKIEVVNKSLNGFITLGSIVGRNSSSGKILNNEINTQLKIYNLANPTSFDEVIGGVSGLNVGEISGVKANIELNRTSTTPSNDTRAISNLGSAVGINHGLLKEVEVAGKLSVTNYLQPTLGLVGVIVAKNSNIGIIKNIKSAVNINFANFNPASYSLVPDQNALSTNVSNLIFNPGEINPPAIITASFLNSTTNSLCDYSSNQGACSPLIQLYSVSATNELMAANSTHTILSNFPVFPGLTLDQSKIWRLMDVENYGESTNKAPQVISASESFEKIGKPFP
ncbi:MAG: hypothetical protein HOP07_16680 [Bacteriovoracaceae bacterium]|nr:hypothetical protein [Bacteriovoracaceae bacterium]